MNNQMNNQMAQINFQRGNLSLDEKINLRGMNIRIHPEGSFWGNYIPNSPERNVYFCYLDMQKYGNSRNMSNEEISVIITEICPKTKVRVNLPSISSRIREDKKEIKKNKRERKIAKREREEKIGEEEKEKRNILLQKIEKKEKFFCNTFCGKMEVFAIYDGKEEYQDMDGNSCYSPCYILDLGWNGIAGNEMERDENSLYTADFNGKEFSVNSTDIYSVGKKIYESNELPENIVIH